jgi:tetratricopeptide (TPR) repeat protein
MNMNESFVKAWEEEIIIPTYETGAPEKNPMFFEKRVYQGSSGAVYPNPIIEKIYDDKKDKKYQAVFLENHFIKLMVLPQLGGRIQMAFDKIGDRHFIYYNEVIKPALVGLCGPWISGGIEFNWPQHHRPSTFEPVDYTIEENEDGSKTIWVNEIEKMFRTKGMAGFTLHPGKAYIEIKVKLFNRTSLPQTFLWWANPAVKVNDDYQSVFPPDVHAVFDHGKRDVSAFPIAKGEYYKVDYSPGTDISRYKNIPVPTSYMAIHSNYDFIGGYEHDSRAGLLHVADHHISPGKKQWTWGYGDFGKAWDRNLTDENGPYIELMTGVFTDNQPDFSWLMPYEEKSFTQYFLPYRELGMVKNASKDLLLHFSVAEGKCFVKLFATSVQDNLELKIYFKNKIILDQKIDLSPEIIFDKEIKISSAASEDEFLVVVNDHSGKELLRYQFLATEEQSIPAAATAPLSPAQTKTNEELFLTGLHLEQYRHATYSPVAYYEEALKRDAGDIRNNNALGVWYLRRGQFKKSESYFRKAIETLTQRNGNPYNGEPLYNLGVCLQLQQRNEEAYTAFYKATWNGAWQANSFFALAQIDTLAEKYEQALQHVQQAIDVNAGNRKAAVLKAALLRKLNRNSEAIQVCNCGLQMDAFNLGLYGEKSRLFNLVEDEKAASQILNTAFNLARGDANSFIEYAIDYSAAGLYEEAIDWLQYYLSKITGAPHPMALYCLAWNYDLIADKKNAKKYFLHAAEISTDYCFPNRLEDILMLEKALQYNPADNKAYYYLGCLWYDKRQYAEAINCWEQSVEIDCSLPVVCRNLGIAYFNKIGDHPKALQYFEKAFALDTNDARILMELDQLYKRLNKPAIERLQFLELHLNQVLTRDDLYLERIALYNYIGKTDKAYNLLMNRHFHPWEGGEGKVSAQYKYCLIQMARNKLNENDFNGAIEFLQQAEVYPPNLGEGKLIGTQENEIFYWLGRAYEGLKIKETALAYFEKATVGSSEPSAAIFYNDPQPDAIFYQGLGWEKLNYPEKATAIFNELVNYGKAHFNDEIQLDYFAVSLPDLLIFEDDLDKRNKLHCTYMMALGCLGLKNIDEARSFFDEVLTIDSMHLRAKLHEQLIPLFEYQELAE